MFYRLSDQQKSEYMSRLRGKIIRLNPEELGSKNLPPEATLGQTVAITKHLLAGLDPAFVNQVMTELAKLLIIKKN